MKVTIKKTQWAQIGKICGWVKTSARLPFNELTSGNGFYLASTTNDTQLILSNTKFDFIDIPGYEHQSGFSFKTEEQGKQLFSAHSNYEYLFKINLKSSVVVPVDNDLSKYNLDPNDVAKITSANSFAWMQNEKLFYTILGKIHEQNGAGIIECNFCFNPSLVKRKFVHKNNILGLDLIATKSEYEDDKAPQNVGQPIKPYESSFEVLQKFMGATGENISPENYSLFSRFVPNKPVTIFRGMQWSPQNLHKLKGMQPSYFKKGSSIKLKFKRASSWTTNEYVAFSFANEQNDGIKAVLKMTVDPENVIIDTRMLDPETLKKLYSHSNQKEIVVKPGTYSCEVTYVEDLKENGKQIPLEQFNIEQIANMQSAFKQFSKTFEAINKVKNYKQINFIEKNKRVLGDWAIEQPTLLIKSNYPQLEFISHIKYENGKFSIEMSMWKPKHKFEKIEFKSPQEIADYLADYKVFESKIKNFIGY